MTKVCDRHRDVQHHVVNICSLDAIEEHNVEASHSLINPSHIRTIRDSIASHNTAHLRTACPNQPLIYAESSFRTASTLVAEQSIGQQRAIAQPGTVQASHVHVIAWQLIGGERVLLHSRSYQNRSQARCVSISRIVKTK